MFIIHLLGAINWQLGRKGAHLHPTRFKEVFLCSAHRILRLSDSETYCSLCDCFAVLIGFCDYLVLERSGACLSVLPVRGAI